MLMLFSRPHLYHSKQTTPFLLLVNRESAAPAVGRDEQTNSSSSSNLFVLPEKEKVVYIMHAKQCCIA